MWALEEINIEITFGFDIIMGTAQNNRRNLSKWWGNGAENNRANLSTWEGREDNT